MSPSAQTHRELKEFLYLRIIDYFDKGKVGCYHKLFLPIVPLTTGECINVQITLRHTRSWVEDKVRERPLKCGRYRNVTRHTYFASDVGKGYRTVQGAHLTIRG